MIFRYRRMRKQSVRCERHLHQLRWKFFVRLQWRVYRKRDGLPRYIDIFPCLITQFSGTIFGKKKRPKTKKEDREQIVELIIGPVKWTLLWTGQLRANSINVNNLNKWVKSVLYTVCASVHNQWWNDFGHLSNQYKMNAMRSSALYIKMPKAKKQDFAKEEGAWTKCQKIFVQKTFQICVMLSKLMLLKCITNGNLGAKLPVVGDFCDILGEISILTPYLDHIPLVFRVI